VFVITYLFPEMPDFRNSLRHMPIYSNNWLLRNVFLSYYCLCNKSLSGRQMLDVKSNQRRLFLFEVQHYSITWWPDNAVDHDLDNSRSGVNFINMLNRSYYMHKCSQALNFYFTNNTMPNFTSTLNQKLHPTFMLHPLHMSLCHEPVRSE